MNKWVVSGILSFFLIGCAVTGELTGPEEVELAIVRPNARTVYFASSLDGFRLHPARKTVQNRWTFSAPSDTEFRYFFIVDGKASIPPCLLKETDDFGSNNCVFQPDSNLK